MSLFAPIPPRKMKLNNAMGMFLRTRGTSEGGSLRAQRLRRCARRLFILASRAAVSHQRNLHMAFTQLHYQEEKIREQNRGA